jgi:hypothetical protein
MWRGVATSAKCKKPLDNVQRYPLAAGSVLGPDRAVGRQVVIGVGLKKLLKLKDWLTVPDAARHLSILFGEDVTEADVLRFGLDGRLTLSAYFVNPKFGRCGKIIPRADAETKEISIESGNVKWAIKKGCLVKGGKALSFGDITPFEGVWDLSMLGAERSQVEHKYQSLTGGPEVALFSKDGALVNRPDGTWGRLLINDIQTDEEYESYPIGGLPSDAVFVVRTSALEALISEPNRTTERPIGQRERDTLLVIIAALAEVQGIDVKRVSKAAIEIESATIRKGARVSVRAIEDHLRRIPDALERKGAED